MDKFTQLTAVAAPMPMQNIDTDKVIPAQNKVREVADELETLVADDLWPMPKYRELLFQY